MFRRVLVANRAEIAIRICRTLREMGIESVAVFSEADRTMPHVRAADHAVEIGPAAPSQSYLNIDRLIDVAKAARCDAVIPGYGFLAERADFAAACRTSGLVFIGPEPEAIAAMGEKQRARSLMAAAGVPLVPGAAANTLEEAEREARRIGFPVLLKAVAGGGGKGMRLVPDERSLPSAFETATREAERAFGNGQLYLEKALQRVRHVEIQVLADQLGHAAHLFERDCSIQRRHQKVVEETPSPHLPEPIRQRMIEVALTAVRSVNYTSAGTLEFLLDEDGQFYFLEMNTRLQVEHAITELVTGLDLVREMVNIAAGLPLSFEPGAVRATGTAIECRVCAEDPAAGYLPRSGPITRLHLPAGPFIRVDSGIEQGSQVGSDYDSLLAKVCAWGATRQEAVSRMARALQEFELSSLTTNLNLLRQVMNDPDYRAGRYDTHYLPDHPELLQAKPSARQVAALAASCLLNDDGAERFTAAAPSPWASSFGRS